MASPFRYFRKNSKVMLAVFVVLLMFSWVVGDSLVTIFGGNRNPGSSTRVQAGDVAVSWDGGSLTNQQVDQMVMRRQMLSDFLQYIEMEGARTAYMAGVEPSSLRVQPYRLPTTRQQEVEQSVVQAKLFADAAREAGISVSDEMLRQYLYQLGRGNVTPQQMREVLTELQKRRGGFSIDDVMNSLREEMLAQNFINSNQYSFRTVTPQQRWKDWLRVNERVIVEAAAIPTDSFLVDVKEPTDAELTEFFDKYKERETMPERLGTTELPSATPGFRIPRKIDVAYLEANYDSYLTKAEEKVTDEQIAKYYEENKNPMFIKADTGLIDDKPAAKEEGKVDEKATSEAKDEKASPPSTPPESEGKGDAAKTEDAVKTDDAPKSDETPKADEAPMSDTPPSQDEKKSSSIDLPLLSPFSLTALLQEDKADAAKADAAKSDAKSDEPKSDAAKSDEPKADAAKSDATPPAAGASPPALVPPTNTPPAGAAPAVPPAPAKPPEFQPLDQVKDIIRRRIAEENVAEELNNLTSKIQGELQAEFEKYLTLVLTSEDEKKPRPGPPKSLTDLAPLAEKYGLKSGTTGPMSVLQFRDTPVGKSRVVDLDRLLFQWLFSGREPDLYEPRLTEADIDGNRFIILKTSDTPGKVPELADVRDEVIKAWRAQKAAEIAEKNAKELAKKAQEAKTPLTSFFADKPDTKVVRTDLFSELTGGDVGIVNGQFGRQPYRLSQPDGIVAPGPAFMKEVFSLKDGDVGAALNHDHSIAYVIRLVEHQPPLADLRTAYLAEANSWPGLGPMIQGHAQEVAMSLAADLTTNANLKWERTPDKINDDESDSESESGG